MNVDFKDLKIPISQTIEVEEKNDKSFDINNSHLLSNNLNGSIRSVNKSIEKSRHSWTNNNFKKNKIGNSAQKTRNSRSSSIQQPNAEKIEDKENNANEYLQDKKASPNLKTLVNDKHIQEMPDKLKKPKNIKNSPYTGRYSSNESIIIFEGINSSPKKGYNHDDNEEIIKFKNEELEHKNKYLNEYSNLHQVTEEDENNKFINIINNTKREMIQNPKSDKNYAREGNKLQDSIKNVVVFNKASS